MFTERKMIESNMRTIVVLIDIVFTSFVACTNEKERQRFIHSADDEEYEMASPHMSYV